jgi:hypothetical protein
MVLAVWATGVSVLRRRRSAPAREAAAEQAATATA